MRYLLSLALATQLLFSSLSVQAKEWDMVELTNQARIQSYQSQKSFQKLFQARRNISVKVGTLLPHLSMGVLLNAATMGAIGGSFFMPLQLIAPLLGFIYPSSWFALKESKLMFEAEKRYYIATIANEINTVEILYLEANKTRAMMEAYKKVQLDLNEVLEHIYIQNEVNPIPFVSYAKLEILKERLDSELKVLDEMLWIQSTELAHAVGLSEKERDSFKIKPIQNFKPTFTKMNLEKLKKEVISRAVEINAGEYLSLASEFAIKKRKWDFLSSSNDPETSIGYSYGSSIQIAKADKKILDLELLEFKERFFSQIEATHKNYELTVDTVGNFKRIEDSAIRYYELAKAKLEFQEANDYKEYAEAIMDYLTSVADKINHEHQILASESNLKRLLYRGSAYKELIPMLWLKTKDDELTKEQKKENRRINKAIKKGEIKLPQTEYLEVE